MSQSKVGIADIAKAMNISTMSVSRALSGKSGISEDLRDRVCQTARDMGYTRQKVDSAGANVLVLHQKPFILDNSNYSAIIQSMEQVLQDRGLDYTIEYVDKQKQDSLYLPGKLSKGTHFDGVIFIGNFNEAYIDFIKPRIRNQVILSGYTPSVDTDSVCTNFNNGGFKQCEYLISKGHRDIGFIGKADYFRNNERILGMRSALEKYGLPFRQDLVLNYEEQFDDALLSLLRSDRRPSALICQWDVPAIKLIKFLSQNGIKVPDDISLIASGNTEMSSLCQPSLTTLDLHIEYSCSTAVELLRRRISDEGKPSENIGINSTLVERDSVKAL